MENIDQQIESTLQKTVDKALELGADACDVVMSQGKQFALESNGGAISKYNVSGSQILGLRVMKDSKVGLAYSEDFSEDSIEWTAKAALGNSEFAEPKETESIVQEGEKKFFSSKFSKDTSSTQEKIDFALQLESEVKKQNPNVLAIPYNGFSEVESNWFYANSKNCVLGASQNYLSCYTSALLGDEKEKGMHYHVDVAGSLQDLDLQACVKNSLEYAQAWLEAKPVPTSKYDVVFAPDRLHELLSVFSNLYSGKEAIEKTNPWGEKMGESVAFNEFTLKDVPQFDRALLPSHIDGEGFLQSDVTLVENGVLKEFYHNTDTAKTLGLKPNSRARRSAKGSLSVGGTTLVVSPGKTSADSLRKGEYLEVHALQGLHSGVNPVSGEFSFAASGFLCRDGERVHSVKQVTVSGNIFQVLKEIVAIGDELKGSSERDFFAPDIRFSQLSVAGA